jgi:hypothetical protein
MTAAEIAAFLGDAKPATDGLIDQLAEATANVREHEHPRHEDLYCFNLVSFMGERMPTVLRRLLDAEARIAELESTPTTVYRASHDSIVMGRYTTAAAAREHCEAEVRREWSSSVTDLKLWWREDEDTVDQPEDGEAELIESWGPHGSRPTGYMVTPLELAAEYDPEADQ